MPFTILDYFLLPLWAHDGIVKEGTVLILNLGTLFIEEAN
jgi:hypothetical protein